MHSMTTTLGILIALFLLVGCRKTEDVPTYVEIPAISVSATGEQGGGSSKITEAWVTVDERSVGVWELPARVPVIGTGSHTIGVTAGIRRNGAYDDRVRYPYYTTWRTTVDLEPAATRVVAPQVQYTSATFWKEQFNEAESQLIRGSGSDTTLQLYSAAARPDATLDGTQCGGFVLDTAHDRVILYTEQDFPGESGPVYLEMDYSTDIELTIGLLYTEEGTAVSEPWVVLVPTASIGAIKWNKVYIDLSDFFYQPGFSGRDIYIGAQLSGGRTSAAGYLDNVKIIRPAS